MEGGREGVTTMSNVTIVTTRHDNGMTVVCEAVNQALFISQSASVIISVYCEYGRPEACLSVYCEYVRPEACLSVH
ncbi:hypothetical protein chiPu_0023870, partial [Chiloscyllium punctatum]|nr:hypothetical protein [Chiloscyllium punctatum]